MFASANEPPVEDATQTSILLSYHQTFVNAGGAIRRTTLTGDALTRHLASRAYWDKYITQQAKANGLLPFYWDEGSFGNNGFGIMNTQNNTVGDQQALDALIQGVQ